MGKEASPAHALPKTHKLGRPPESEEVRSLKLCLIVPAYTSFDFLLCKHLTTILHALPRPPHSLNSLEKAAKLIQRFNPRPKTILVSFDVVAMYPSIDIGRSCAVVQQELEQYQVPGLRLRFPGFDWIPALFPLVPCPRGERA